MFPNLLAETIAKPHHEAGAQIGASPEGTAPVWLYGDKQVIRLGYR